MSTKKKSAQTGSGSGRSTPDRPARGDEVGVRLDQMWRQWQADLRDIEADVPADYWFGTEPDRVYQGECFWRAYLYVQMHYPRPGVLYVYGYAAIGWGLHAWVELPGDVVFDGTLQRFYHRAGYYERQDARAFYRFTSEAAGHIFVELDRRLGKVVWYWDRFLDLPWSRPGTPPLLVDLAEAERRIATSPRMPPPRPTRKRTR